MTARAEMFTPLTAPVKDTVPAENTVGEGWHSVPVPDNAKATPPHPLGQASSKWAYRDETGRLLFWIYRFDLPNGDKQILPLTFCQHTDGNKKWFWKAWPSPRPIYNLDKLLTRPDAPVIVCEGEKAADAASVIFPGYVVVTSPNGAKAAGKADWSPLSGRKVVIWPDHDAEGSHYAAAVSCMTMAAGAASVAVVRVPAAFPEKWDLADALPEGVSEDVLQRLLNETAPDVPKACDESDAETIARLAALSPLEYEKVREAEAKRLGFRVGVLDKEVEALRHQHSAQAISPRMFPEVDPWPYPVDGAALLHEIVDAVRRFIICDKETAVATALWCAFTWVVDHVQVAPLAIITAPEKRCGKTQLLNFIAKLARKPLLASNISPSATFRVMEACHPTLLIDEADTFLKDNEELRGVINSGHTKQSAYVLRNVGDNHEPTQFSTWGAKAISGIGALSDTLMDRAIILTLRRKLSGETIQRLRHAETGMFEVLASKLARFANDAGTAIGQARPALPDALNDRAQDNWEPLLAIADYVGGEWPRIARSAAITLSGAEHESVSLSVELLADIREVFENKRIARISTADLINALCNDDEKSWATYNRGQPMKPRQLAKRLGEYGIASKTVRIGYETPRGFDRAQFEDAFTRYLSSPAGTTTPQMSASAGDDVADTVASGETNMTSETLKLALRLDCGVVADFTCSEASAEGGIDRVTKNPI